MNELVKGVMTIIAPSLALGQYPKLERWARRQAAEALVWREPSTPFFPSTYQRLFPAQSHHHKALDR